MTSCPMINICQLQYYLTCRKHVGEFRSRANPHLDLLQGEAREELSRKYSRMIMFDFEAAARLKEWEDLSKMVDVGNVGLWSNL